MKESSPVNELYPLDLLAPLKYYIDAAPKRSKNKQFIFSTKKNPCYLSLPGHGDFPLINKII